LPKFVTLPAPPTVIAVPAKLALFVTARLVEPSVIAPVEVRDRLFAVLEPASAVDESSWIATAPAELTVRLPKLSESPAAAPMVIDVPAKEALPATERTAAGLSVIAPLARTLENVSTVSKAEEIVPLANVTLFVPAPAPVLLMAIEEPMFCAPVKVSVAVPSPVAVLPPDCANAPPLNAKERVPAASDVVRLSLVPSEIDSVPAPLSQV